MEQSSPKSFVVDSMLGRLARWLRLTGFDTLYKKVISDKELLTIALKENRILLTRDRELHQQAIKEGLQSKLIPSIPNKEVLSFLSKSFNIKFEIDPSNSRCPLCNGEISSVEKEKVQSKLPHPTSEQYEQFWQCTQCGKIYWMGGHYKSMMKLIAEINSVV